MGDDAWRELAEGSREALAQLGYHTEPRCLPGEPDACGGTYAEHFAANLAALKAVIDHHLTHLGTGFVAAIFPPTYRSVAAGLAGMRCRGAEKGPQ